MLRVIHISPPILLDSLTDLKEIFLIIITLHNNILWLVNDNYILQSWQMPVNYYAHRPIFALSLYWKSSECRIIWMTKCPHNIFSMFTVSKNSVRYSEDRIIVHEVCVHYYLDEIHLIPFNTSFTSNNMQHIFFLILDTRQPYLDCLPHSKPACLAPPLMCLLPQPQHGAGRAGSD